MSLRFTRGTARSSGIDMYTNHKDMERKAMEMKDPFDLTGRVALITGANSHGIGNESAKVLAEHGAKVFLTARREDKLQKAVEEIEAAGASAAYRVTDVSNEEDCKAAIEECVATFGRLDIMVLSPESRGFPFRADSRQRLIRTTGARSWVSIWMALCS